MRIKKMTTLFAGKVIDGCSADELHYAVMTKGLEGYQYVVAPLKHPRCCMTIDDLKQQFHQKFGQNADIRRLTQSDVRSLLPACGVPDIIMYPDYWSTYVVGRISPWIDADSQDPFIRRMSEQELSDELRYFAYLNLRAALFPLRGTDHSNMARLINYHLNAQAPNANKIGIWAVVPMTVPIPPEHQNGTVPEHLNNGNHHATENGYESDSTGVSEYFDPSPDTWQWFQAFRSACDNHAKMGVCLEVTESLLDDVRLDRWRGEPLKALKFNTNIFKKDVKSGLPVLNKNLEHAVQRLFMAKGCEAIVSGELLISKSSVAQTSDEGNVNERCIYYKYLNDLWQKKPCWEHDYGGTYAAGYEDYLQAPLQPLGDNLDSQIYETFELDPVKYIIYGQAIDLAIAKKIDTISTTNNAMVLMVLGAGRGPLVSAAYEMLKKRKVLNFKLYAVEKNPNAIPTLMDKMRREWNNEVEVIWSDMRKFNPPQKADIIISELLGSFGDNELSPECLDGALPLMKDDCISIPCSYTSYIGPIHSPVLFNAVRDAGNREHDPKLAYETGYVCRVVSHFEVAPHQPLFTFTHPNTTGATNDRAETLTFKARESAEVMGFIGYFSATLIDNIEISIVAGNSTPKMFSWFPIVFPLKTPVFVKKNDQIRLHFWRRSNDHKVWYEWGLDRPTVTPVMNPRGRSYFIRK